MFIQSLIRGEESCQDINQYLNDTSLIIPGSLLESFNLVEDLSDNAVMLRFEF